MSTVHLARDPHFGSRSKVLLARYTTFCGISTSEAVTLTSWRLHHSTFDENVCAECRAALVTARLSVEQD